MATLVFTAIGTALGGPIGGAIGALAGQVIDMQVLRPRGSRTGPRLTDLNVQTSRYGAPVPRIFGRMRVAGSVIWATDLVERSATTRGGKGQPSVTSYTYSASLAVALSSRPVRRIGRIWADGNLLRGGTGDFKSPLGALRLHDGRAGQSVDPLIAAAMGAGQTPAFRGLAYMVLEDLQLADFGNRIPSLTVELIADEGAVAVSNIASDLLGRPVDWTGGEEPAVLGYAAEGEDAGDALAPLLDAHRLRWRANGPDLALAARVETGRTLMRSAELRAIDGREDAAGELGRRPLEAVPAALAVRHFDPARDYQLGVQTALRPGTGRRSEELGLPAAISADAARRLADESLRAELAGRRTLIRAAGWSALDLMPGDTLFVEGEAGQWLLDRLEWEDMAPRLSLRAVSSGAATMPDAGDTGQPVLPPDLVQGETSLALVELPPPEDALAQTPLVFAAATGATAGWRRAALFRYRAAGETAEPAGRTAARAVLGQAMDALGPGHAGTFDARGSVEIMLDNETDALDPADDAELLAGANLCMLGEEILQFGRAEPVAPRRYRLSRLLRGWHGTEWATDGHGAGDRFVLLDAARLIQVALTPADMGQWLEMRASGSGDMVPAQAARIIDGRAILPPAPVHAVMREADGDLHLRWTRRSRLGWLWSDLAEVPLGEEREAYRIIVMAALATLREIETPVPSWTYPAAARAADLIAADGAPIRLRVSQIGTFGAGRPLDIPLT